MKPTLLLVVLLTACTGDVDEQWQLLHDRIIAVRASPPGIASGETSRLDGLLGFAAQPPAEAEPDSVVVVSPTSLQGTVSRQPSGWTVTAPSEDELAAARTELDLPADAPVPLQLQMAFADNRLPVLKGVMLGVHVDNPVLDPITIDGMDAVTADELVVPTGVHVPLAVSFDETFNINWLTSCGEMHDFDLANAYLIVASSDAPGTLAVVVRDGESGIAWKTWPISGP